MSFLSNTKSAQPKTEATHKREPQEWEVCPIPPLSQITYVQAAFIDNGEEGSARAAATRKLRKDGQGRKSNAQRYKLDLEVWTVPPGKIRKANGAYNFKRKIELRPPMPFLNLVEGQEARGTISAAFAKRLSDFVLDIPTVDRERCLFGQVHHTNGGRAIHPDQFVVVTHNADDELIAFVMIGNEELLIDGFNDLFATSHIKYTARVDRCGYEEYKASNKHEG